MAEYTNIEYITPETARLYLEKNTINRPLKDKIVRFYLSIMQRGEWVLTNDAITFGKDGTLLNGQHRLKALSEFDKPLPFIVARDFEDDVFKCMDSGVSRTASDVLAILKVPNHNGIAAGIKKYLLLEKKGTITKGGRGKDAGISNEMIKNEYEKRPDFWQRMHNSCVAFYCQLPILTASDMVGYSAHIIGLGWEEDIVMSFFGELCSLTTPSNKTLLLLRKRLHDAKIGKSISIPTTQRQELLIKTFNYYVEKKSVKVLKISDEEHGKIWFNQNN